MAIIEFEFKNISNILFCDVRLWMIIKWDQGPPTLTHYMYVYPQPNKQIIFQGVGQLLVLHDIHACLSRVWYLVISRPDESSAFFQDVYCFSIVNNLYYLDDRYIEENYTLFLMHSIPSKNKTFV